MRFRALGLLALVFVAPLAHADECRVDLGRGWPPATENYGAAVEKLFAGDAQPMLAFTRLPGYGAESGLQLIRGEGEGDWTLRYSEADERVRNWNSGSLQLQVNQQPDMAEVPMPSALAARVVADWQRALATLAPEGTTAAFHEADVALFVVDGLRVSGLAPGCGPGELLMAQLELMIEATDDGENKRAKRWRKLEQSLDELEQALVGDAAGETNGND